MSVRVPALGEGFSSATLSVELSKRGSSLLTGSPGFLSHLVMVPSKIDSPIWGMITSVAMVAGPWGMPQFYASWIIESGAGTQGWEAGVQSAGEQMQSGAE